MLQSIKAALFGLSIGDALGVPVEFLSRQEIAKNPVVDMRGFGTHRQSAGTWSDDSSLAFCLAASLCNGYNLDDIANNFVNWYQHSYWTPHGEVFDVGISTAAAISKFEKYGHPTEAGGSGEADNGNGSLMRILPLIFYLRDKPVENRFQLVKDVSSITHRHQRSVIGCFIYTEYAFQLLAGLNKTAAFSAMQKIVNDYLIDNPEIDINEVNRFHRILENPINDDEISPLKNFPENDIYSTGYVLHTLEASLWCILTSNSYSEAVLKAVNLGSDTDTTGCVTGGLAGLLYGFEAIPEEWINVLARKEDIEELCERLSKKMG